MTRPAGHTGHARALSSTLVTSSSFEEAHHLTEVRHAEPGCRVEDRPRGSGVEQVVVAGAGRVEWRERRIAVRRGPVEVRVPEARAIPERRVNQRRRTVQLDRKKKKKSKS